jgi:hypothetical protein
MCCCSSKPHTGTWRQAIAWKQAFVRLISAQRCHIPGTEKLPSVRQQKVITTLLPWCELSSLIAQELSLHSDQNPILHFTLWIQALYAQGKLSFIYPQMYILSNADEYGQLPNFGEEKHLKKKRFKWLNQAQTAYDTWIKMTRRALRHVNTFPFWWSLKLNWIHACVTLST